MSEDGLESWAEDLTARERVREIATTLTQPRSVEWVREQAGIAAWQTAKDELEMLAEFGQVQAVTGDDGHTKYAPDYQQRYFDELAGLINDHTREELREQIATIQERIDGWKSEYAVDSQADLDASLSEAGHDAATIRERNRVLRRWERAADNQQLLRQALQLYDDARSLHPDRQPTDASVSVPE
jgi:hypothetical protein